MHDLPLRCALLTTCLFYVITPLIGIWDLTTHDCPTPTACTLAIAIPLIVWATSLLIVTAVTATDDLETLSVIVAYTLIPYTILATMMVAEEADYRPFTNCVFAASLVLFALAIATIVTLLYLTLNLIKCPHR